jgi:hypothetical protein
MLITSLNKRTEWLFYLFYFILFLFTCNNSFFWDTVQLASMHAWWYYENDFRFFFLPHEMDSGHPPLLGLVLAALWKLSGPSLFYSHLLMLPFVFLTIRQVLSLCDYLFTEKLKILAAALILFNSILMSQAGLVSPDVIMYCFFFFTLDGVFKKKKSKILFGSLVLASISMRGMMCAFSLFIFQAASVIIDNRKIAVKAILYSGLLFIPAGLLISLFLYFHYLHAGWIGYHTASPWAPSFKGVDTGGFFYNIALLLWRVADFGNIFIWLFMGGGLFFFSRGRLKICDRSRKLLILFFVLCVIYVFPLLFYDKGGLLGHRYFFPVISAATLLLFSLAEMNMELPVLKKLAAITLAGMLTGFLWVYPDSISKGWDSTLAHLPYYGLRKQALNYLKKNKISFSETGACFPYNDGGKFIDLKTGTEKFADKNFTFNKYILYSNIANDFTDDELAELKRRWISVKSFGRWPVRFVLYKNPRFAAK